MKTAKTMVVMGSPNICEDQEYSYNLSSPLQIAEVSNPEFEEGDKSDGIPVIQLDKSQSLRKEFYRENI